MAPPDSRPRRSSQPGPSEATWSSRSLAFPAVRALGPCLGPQCTVCDDVWLHGSRFVLKGKVSGGGRKRKKLSPRFSRSLESWPPRRAAGLCLVQSLGSRHSAFSSSILVSGFHFIHS